MADINLLQTPTTQSTSISTRSRTLLARVLMLVLVFVVLYYGYLQFDSWRTNKNIADTEAGIAAAQAEALNSKERAEVLTRQGQLKALDPLLEDHMYWSYLLPELARVTLVSAKYTSIQADGAGKLDLTVQLPSYEELEKYMQIFDLPEYNKEFSNVRIMSISQMQTPEGSSTIVRMQLSFNPAYLKGRM